LFLHKKSFSHLIELDKLCKEEEKGNSDPVRLKRVLVFGED